MAWPSAGAPSGRACRPSKSSRSSNPIGPWDGSRVACGAPSARLEVGHEAPELSRRARAVDPFEGDEMAREVVMESPKKRGRRGLKLSRPPSTNLLHGVTVTESVNSSSAAGPARWAAAFASRPPSSSWRAAPRAGRSRGLRATPPTPRRRRSTRADVRCVRAARGLCLLRGARADVAARSTRRAAGLAVRPQGPRRVRRLLHEPRCLECAVPCARAELPAALGARSSGASLSAATRRTAPKSVITGPCVSDEAGHRHRGRQDPRRSVLGRSRQGRRILPQLPPGHDLRFVSHRFRAGHAA